jgi:hypothetical protein
VFLYGGVDFKTYIISLRTNVSFANIVPTIASRYEIAIPLISLFEDMFKYTIRTYTFGKKMSKSSAIANVESATFFNSESRSCGFVQE